jgi:hypothetical protein
MFLASGAALAAVEVCAEESKLECKTVKVHRCDVRADGTTYNCRDETHEKCTVVSGPGSGKKYDPNSSNLPTIKVIPKAGNIGIAR